MSRLVANDNAERIADHGSEKINNSAASKTLTGGSSPTLYECEVDLDGTNWVTSCQ